MLQWPWSQPRGDRLGNCPQVLDHDVGENSNEWTTVARGGHAIGRSKLQLSGVFDLDSKNRYEHLSGETDVLGDDYYDNYDYGCNYGGEYQKLIGTFGEHSYSCDDNYYDYKNEIWGSNDYETFGFCYNDTILNNYTTSDPISKIITITTATTSLTNVWSP